MAAYKDVALQIIILCEAGASGDMATSSRDWESAETTHPGLKVTIVEVAGRVAQQTVARALFQCCVDMPPLNVTLEFSAPLIGDVRSINLEAHCDTHPLCLDTSHCTLCGCHGAPVALRGADGGPLPLPQNKLQCPVTGTPLDPRQCLQDGKTICLGNNPSAGVLSLKAPLSIAPSGVGTEGAVLRVLSRVNLTSFNAALIQGPPLTLRAHNYQNYVRHGTEAGFNIGAVPRTSVLLNMSLQTVNSEQLLGIVARKLKATGEGLVCFSTTDIHSRHSGVFRQHYLLVPFSDGSSSPGLCALKVASMEELAPPPVPASREVLADVPLEVVEAVEGQLSKMLLEEYNPTAYSSKVHETVEMLIRESRPPKPVPVAATGTGADQGPAGEGGEKNVAVAGAPVSGRTVTAPRPCRPGTKAAGQGTGPQGGARRGSRR